VWHSHPYVELGVDAGSNGPLRVASRVVEQHFIISHVDADWGQPGQISIKWRRQGTFGIALAQVGTHEARGLGPHEVRVASARVSKLSPVSARSVTGDSTTAPSGAILAEPACAVVMDKSTSARLPPAESPVRAIFFVPRSTSQR
jgi:hypothetical protein